MSHAPLPAPLQPWHPWLQWFAPDLALQLGPMLRRMHPLLGRFSGQRLGGASEPDGLEDLRRKGSYERLLSTEWLLASDLPDEFLRRAASGEHLFLAPRPRGRKVDRLIVALFDAGPWQMGAPRLAHIALWILLARRALEAGGELRWGLLHEPGRCHEASTPKNLKDMLRGRTLHSAGAVEWQQWSQWLAQQDTPAGETWLIGHRFDAADAGNAQPTHSVMLRLALDGQALNVGLRAGATSRTMELPLPEPHPAAQLLRGRFEEGPAVHAGGERLSLKVDPIISPNGTLVAVPLLEGHGVMLHRVQALHARPQPPKRVQWNKNAQPLAASFSGKVIGVVLSMDQKLSFWQMPNLAPQERPAREAFDAPPGRRTLLPSLWTRDRSHTRLFVIDASHQLVYWVSGHRNGSSSARGPMLLDRQVLGMAPTGENSLVYACAEGGHIWLRFAGVTGRDSAELRLMELSPDHTGLPAVFFGGCQNGLRGWGGVALQLGTEEGRQQWRVFEREYAYDRITSWDLRLPPGARAVGLVRDVRHVRFGLVVQAAGGEEFTRQFKDGAETLFALPAPAERTSLCPRSGLLAVLTRDRALHVHSAADRSPRLVVPGTASAVKGTHEPD